ncbi:choice-of-anchor H family protein [Thalassotalea profundi]|uniref:GlyGly-CTERM sorting domain-containing protein n=1 Tax=Thalassotalea profundi TaxID=2036687 RepID=A0ABQ3IKA9_9GAMM|nr:choice-of-anchor H family protein [Thalassotalea profundi]GHE84866.1 hypothetical protein GCM10011501_12170 [Thalassotalea profundi]
MTTFTRALTIFSTVTTLIISSATLANEKPLSFSLEQTKDKQSKEEILSLIKNKVENLHSDKNLEKTQYLPREQHQKQKLNTNVLVNKQKLTTKNASSPRLSNSAYYSFSIYQGYAQLIEDFDEDGYYQTFSVTFDADVLTTSNDYEFDVYAELYLSKNGGPWIHYYTTDYFTLFGESEDDIYEVYTTLDQGYPTDEYDILIDLYEVGYNDIVASYSSDDTNDLYALPLESTDYDPEYIVVHEHGGTSSVGVIMLLLGLLFIRGYKVN